MSIEFDNFDKVVECCKTLAIYKNKQYGVKNLLIFDGFGILTRMNDKIARLNNLLTETEPSNHGFKRKINESINDTIMDLINYSIYLYLFLNKMLLKKGESK